MPGEQRHHSSLSDLVGSPWTNTPVGQVDWADVAVGADQTRRGVALGVRLFHFHDQPVAVRTRRNSRVHGNGVGVIEVLCPDSQTASDLLGSAQTNLMNTLDDRQGALEDLAVGLVQRSQDIESVMRRFDSDSPSPSEAISSAFFTSSKL